MPTVYRPLINALFVALCVVWIVPEAPLASGQDGEFPEADIELVEHSGEIFVGTIDIVTGVSELDREDVGPSVNTDYTVLVSDVLKGELKPQSIVVLRQDGGTLYGVDEYHEGDGPLIPGNQYLFFARYSPGTAVYRITEPGVGNLPINSDEERADLISYWSEVVERTACQHTDILKLDGVIYARRNWNDDKRYLERDWVGATIATVQHQDTSATGCRDDLPDGVASEIPAGTKVQRLKGYAPSFRVAVRLPDKHRHLYEAIWSEKARKGEDLLDIYRRVTSLEAERWHKCDDVAMCQADLLRTTNWRHIGYVFQALNNAPVEPQRSEWRHRPSKWLRLTFTLDDASTVTLWISLESGLSQSGIRVPVDDLVRYLWGNSGMRGNPR